MKIMIKKDNWYYTYTKERGCHAVGKLDKVRELLYGKRIVIQGSNKENVYEHTFKNIKILKRTHYVFALSTLEGGVIYLGESVKVTYDNTTGNYIVQIMEDVRRFPMVAGIFEEILVKHAYHIAEDRDYIYTYQRQIADLLCNVSPFYMRKFYQIAKITKAEILNMLSESERYMINNSWTAAGKRCKHFRKLEAKH